MWIFTTSGFFSVVQDRQNKENVVIRSRVLKDLENLREFLPALGSIISTSESDYPYRAIVPKHLFGLAMMRMVGSINYPNFKDQVKLKQGNHRAGIYTRIWEIAIQLEGTKAGKLLGSIETNLWSRRIAKRLRERKEQSV